jgi:hypothetical protein
MQQSRIADGTAEATVHLSHSLSPKLPGREVTRVRALHKHLLRMATRQI